MSPHQAIESREVEIDVEQFQTILIYSKILKHGIKSHHRELYLWYVDYRGVCWGGGREKILF